METASHSELGKILQENTLLKNRFPCFLELFWQVQMPTTGFSILLQVRLQLVSRLTYVADDFLELKKKQNSRLLVEHVESK